MPIEKNGFFCTKKVEKIARKKKKGGKSHHGILHASLLTNFDYKYEHRKSMCKPIQVRM